MRYIIILSFLCVLLSACSAGKDATMPSANSNQNLSMELTYLPVYVSDTNSDCSPSEGLGIMGLFNLSVSPDGAQLTPIRRTSLADVLEVVDITNFLSLAPCTDCVTIDKVALDLDGNIVVTIGIKHPFPVGDPLKPVTGKNRADLHVFNVEGIVISNSAATSYPAIGQLVANFKLVNADGYTGYLDAEIDEFYPTDASIHPYITHFDDYSAGNFSPSNSMGFQSVTYPPPSGNLVMAMGCDYNYQDYAFDLNGAANMQFIFAVGCTYAVSAALKSMRFSPEYRIPQHNKKAASEVSFEIVSNDLRSGDTLSTAQIKVHVVDISHDVVVGDALNEMFADSSVSEIRIEIPGVTSTPVIIDGGSPVSGTGHSPSDPLIYEGMITNSLGAPEGNYAGLIKVTDNYAPGQNIYPVLQGMDGIKRVEPSENPLDGLFDISEFATYQVFDIDVAMGEGLTITSPNGGEIWEVCSHHDITWSSTGSIGNVMLEYSTDDFISDINVIIADTENDGVFDWFVPDNPTANAKVRVSEVAAPSTFDISDGPFTITRSTTPIWPYFGCDAKGRCLSAYNGTTNDNIKWTYSLEVVCSCPSIGPDGTIYCGIYTSGKPGLVAINSDGSQKWKHYPGLGNFYGREPAVSPDGLHVYYGGDAGIAGGYRGRIYCLNTCDGSQDWFYQLNNPPSWQYELIDGGPKIGPDGTIYFQSLVPAGGAARMWAINPDGAYKWYHNIIGYSYSDNLYHSPCIGNDGYIYVTDSAGELWKFDSVGNSLWPAVYVNYETRYPGSLDDDNNFYVACDMGQDVNKFAPDGTQLWTSAPWDYFLHCSPAHDSSGFIYATGGWSGYDPVPVPPDGYRLRKMDPTDGSTIWEKPLHAITTAMMAVSADGHIYIGCGNGASAGPGLQCWDTDGNQIFSLAFPYQAGSPAIGADGTVYVEANHVLYAIGD